MGPAAPEVYTHVLVPPAGRPPAGTLVQVSASPVMKRVVLNLPTKYPSLTFPIFPA
jgi:hypothetical protein